MSGESLSSETQPSALELSETERVAAFLREHPAFLQQRPDLLAQLDLPHGGTGAVSLVERQVTLLRERNIEMRNRLATMTRNAETNDSLFAASRDMVLALLECRQPAQLAQRVEQGLVDHFGVEHAMALWLTQAAPWLDVMTAPDANRASTIEVLLKGKRAFCGVFRGDEMMALFPGTNGEGSAAVAPLIKNNELIGAIAVGSSDIRRYDSEVGTLFLEHLADVIVRLPLLDQTAESTLDQ